MANGIGGVDANNLELIYDYLLQQYHQDVYSFILIHQIDDDSIDELIINGPGRNRININIRNPVLQGFKLLNFFERNKFRIDVVHEGLRRIALKEGKLDIQSLENIKNEIVNKHFAVDIEFIKFKNPKYDDWVGKVVISPEEHKFVFYAIIEKSGIQICKILLYIGQPNKGYVNKYFSSGKWKNLKEIVIKGNSDEMEFQIKVDKCEVQIVNHTQYTNPPYFEMMRFGISMEAKEQAKKDWQHSQPPWVTGLIDRSAN